MGSPIFHGCTMQKFVLQAWSAVHTYHGRGTVGIFSIEVQQYINFNTHRYTIAYTKVATITAIRTTKF